MRLKSTSTIKDDTAFFALCDNVSIDTVALEKSKAALDEKIQKLRERHAADHKPIADSIKASVILAEHYFEEHRERLLPAGKKSAETLQSKFGSRTSTPALKTLNRKWTLAKAIDSLKAAGRAGYIKISESLDKKKLLLDLPDDELARHGLRRDQQDTFFIEPKRDSAASPNKHTTAA